MGRQANTKWRLRRVRYRRAGTTEQLRLFRLFGRHRKFRP